MAPKNPLWKLEPHTLGKHLVLRRYLEAWFPIMGSWNTRILFIDGFAGPGEYEDGEEGSPIIAMKSLLEHRSKGRVSAEVVFMFIEKDRDRAAHLEGLVSNLHPPLPSNCKAIVLNSAFDLTLTKALDQLDAQAKKLAPCFVMVDPFGISDTPMDVIGRVLRNPRSEVYVSFMYEFINRFKETPEFERHLDRLFGRGVWRDGIEIDDQEKRKQFFYDLYENQLRRAGAEYVVRFEMYEGQRLVYAIFFATHSLIGCDKMKQAIWKVAPFGDFAFRGARSGQLGLDLRASDFGPLKSALSGEFRAKGWVTIEQIAAFVASDNTDYHTSQFKTNALMPMEMRRESKSMKALAKGNAGIPTARNSAFSKVFRLKSNGVETEFERLQVPRELNDEPASLLLRARPLRACLGIRQRSANRKTSQDPVRRVASSRVHLPVV